MSVNKQAGTQVFTGQIQSRFGALRQQLMVDVATASATALKSAQATSSSVTTTVTSFSAQPDVPRNLVITSGGTTADVPAGSVVVTGTDYRGAVITENFTFTADQAGAITGNKAFKTVTSVVFPIQDGAAATYNIGTGVKLGLMNKMSVASVIDAFIDGVRETTAATVAFSATSLADNTVTTSTAPNGTRDIAVLFATTELSA